MIKRYGSSLEQLIYTPLGYGISKGKIVNLDHWGDKVNAEHYNHVHVAFEKGGLIQPIKKSPNIKSLQSFASYDDEVTIMIQPIIIEKTVPVGSNRKSLNFPGGGSGIVNRSSTYSQLSIR